MESKLMIEVYKKTQRNLNVFEVALCKKVLAYINKLVMINTTY